MDPQDHDLEKFFEAARANGPALDPERFARIVADGRRLQPAQHVPRRAAGDQAGRAGWRALGQRFGWVPAGGLALAGLVGLWVGWADPAGMATALVGGEADWSLDADDLSALIEGGEGT